MTNTQKPEENYKAGACNIGEREIKRRMAVAWLGLFLSLILYVLLTDHRVNRWQYAWEFFPLMIFSLGLIQARSKFCVAYGWRNLANFGSKADTFSITDQEAIKADRQFALTILVRAIGVSIIVAGLIIGIS
jgi:hypothetical protein